MNGKTKTIVLDFDNCIALDADTRIGSEEIKDEAWFAVYPEYERYILEPLLENAKKKVAGGKGDRKDIVAELGRHFGVSEASIAQEIIKRCDKFNQVVQNGIKTINISARTRNALSELSARLPLYINTATPRENALESLDALGLTLYFKEVYGRPGTKVQNMLSVISAESIKPDELLFVDDQQSGYLAAHEAGCNFIGIHTAKNKTWHQGTHPFPIIYFLDELLKKI